MPDFIKPLIDVISKTYFLPLSIAIVFWLFRYFPSFISDSDLEKNSLWIILGFVCTVYSLLFPLGKLGPLFKKGIDAFLEKKKLKDKIKHIENTIRKLTATEKNILQEYVDRDTRSLTFRYSNGTIGHLCNLGILYRGSTLAKIGDEFDFVMQDFVMDF